MAIINFLKNYERLARFKFGNFEGMKGPGPVWMIPILHSGARVDLRTEVIDIPRQRNITKDCLLYTSPSPRDGLLSRMPSSA